MAKTPIKHSIWRNRIQELCDAKGITRYRLSIEVSAILKENNPSAVGVSNQYLQALVNEERGAPSYDVLKALKEVLGVEKVEDLERKE